MRPYRLRNLLTNRLILNLRTLSHVQESADLRYQRPDSSFGLNHVLDTVEPLSLSQVDEHSYSNDFLLEELFPEEDYRTLYSEKDVDTTLIAVVSHALFLHLDTFLNVKR